MGGLGREPCTAHGGGGSAKDDEGSAKDGRERHWDQPKTARDQPRTDERDTGISQ